MAFGQPDDLTPEQALSQTFQEEQQNQFIAPSYLVAADNHSLANNNQSFLDGAVDTISSIGTFIGLSMVSGLNQIYNIAPTLGNYAGGDFELSKTADVIQGLDEDLGAYYAEHEESIDVGGFLLSSLVPGMAGIKGLNMGQKALASMKVTGRVGKNMQAAAGFATTTRRQQYLDKAIKEVSSTKSLSLITNKNTLKAMGAGYGAAVLDMAAFETATAIALSSSPVLEEQDFGDIATNIAVFGLAFGTFGGAFAATKAGFAVKNARIAVEKKQSQFSQVLQLRNEAPAASKVAFSLNEMEKIRNTPEQVINDAIGTGNKETIERNIEAQLAFHDNLVRKNLTILAGNDEKLGATAYMMMTAKGGGKNSQADYLGATNLSRRLDLTPEEKIRQQVLGKINKGGGIDNLEALDEVNHVATSYINIWGDLKTMGNSTITPPKYSSLSDKLRKGEVITVDAGGVTAGKVRYAFTQGNTKLAKGESRFAKQGRLKEDAGTGYSVLEADALENEARGMWALELPAWNSVDDIAKRAENPNMRIGHTVDENDIPLLEKMYREFHTDHQVRTAGREAIPAKPAVDREFISFRDRDDLYKYILERKTTLSNQMMRDSATTKAVNETTRTVIKVEQRGFVRRPRSINAVLSAEGKVAIKETFDAVSKIPRNHKRLFRMGTSHGNYTDDINKLEFSPADPKKVEKISFIDVETNQAGTFKVAGTENEFKVPKRVEGKSSSAQEVVRTESVLPAKNVRSHEEIAASVNVTPEWLNGEIRTVDYDRSLFALRGYADDYAELQVGLNANKVIDPKGKKLLTKTAQELADTDPIYKQPKTMKMTYDTRNFRGAGSNMELDGMAIVYQQERLAFQRRETVLAGYFGDDFAKFPPISHDVMLEAENVGLVGTANTGGAGGKFFTAASSNPGSLGSQMEWIGKATSEVMGKAIDKLGEVLDPSLIKLAGRQEAAIEWSVLNADLRSFGNQKYVIADDGTKRLMRKEIALWNKQKAEGTEGLPLTPPEAKTLGAPDFYPPVGKDGKIVEVQTEEAWEITRTHMTANGSRVESKNELRRAEGLEDKIEADEFYPIPVNPKDVPFFAIITDSSMTTTGHSKMIYANTEADLEVMLNKLGSRTLVPGRELTYQADNWTIHTKKDAEDYYKSFGQFDKTRTLNDNYLDAAMERKGISSPAFVATDPIKIVDDIRNWHTADEVATVRIMVESKYEKEFEYLRQRGRDITNLSTSKFNSTASQRNAEQVVKNPFMDYIRTALNVKNYADYPFWVNANLQLEGKATEMYDAIARTFKDAKTPEELGKINALLTKYQYKGMAYDKQMELIVNHTAPKAPLQKFIQNSNAILATTILRLDAMNAVTNAVSANILYGAEMKSILRAIEAGGKENAIGDLAKLKDIMIPGTDQSMLSTGKILANAYKAFGRDNAEMKFFKDHGFVTTISDQYKSVIDNLTLTGVETGAQLTDKTNKAFKLAKDFADKGEKVTGNRLAEEFNRFVAAHSMKQLTDIAVKNGVMDSKSALAYINTFVNRTQGNYLASQRPMLFQGAIGQSIGLFQTYQFNLGQQLLRHMGEGTAKDTATLIGLQGTIFGLNGLPAFNAINTHIIGTASGNEEHRDAYTTVYGAAGKNAGDWLMYGLASNMLLHPDLKTNLYVRGDINPRNVTIVPVNPANIPIVQAAGKFFGNIWDTSKKIANGGDVTTAVLQGLEHNGISRPLAGIAQTLQGLANPENASYSTSKRGNVIGSNDIFSLVNMGRMLGGKPLGEAVAVDAAYRVKAYNLADSARRNDLGEAIKSTVIAGKNPSQGQIDYFSEQYAGLGGRAEEFNSWFLQLYTTANTSQANEIRRSLSSPFSQDMQQLMGGYELNDFTN